MYFFHLKNMFKICINIFETDDLDLCFLKFTNNKKFLHIGPDQGCQMVCFQTKKKTNLGKFWRVLQWKMLV
jgi:hypothetical protein